jgi:subtilisin family serine protease
LAVKIWKLLAIILSLTAAACRPPTRTAAPLKSDSPSGKQHTVMILDTGFDVNHPVFANKIIDKYTVKCSQDSEISKCGDGSCSYEDFKTEEIEKIPADVKSCEIKSEITLDLDPNFEKIKLYKDRWNSMINGKRGVSFEKSVIDQIQNTISPPTGTGYHGTATAGLIAYKNPDVRLVLVEIPLNSADSSANSSDTSIADKINCIPSKLYTQTLKLFADPDYQKAYSENKASEVTNRLNEIAALNDVTVVNESFGTNPRIVLEKIFKTKGCEIQDMRPYFAALGNLDKIRRDYRMKHQNWIEKPYETLTIKSAGNDGATINDITDIQLDDCHDLENYFVVVGSYDYKSTISEFSNRGSCVDLYSLGETVVVAAPQGFETIASGTSFSAPLTVRYITKSIKAEKPAQMMAELLKARDQQSQFLPKNTWPAEIAYENWNTIGNYALTSEDLESRNRPTIYNDQRNIMMNPLRPLPVIFP